MTISLSGFNQMRAAIEALPAGQARTWSLSLLALGRWMLDSDEPTYFVVAHYMVDGAVERLHLNAHDMGADRWYTICNMGKTVFWDMAAQKMSRTKSRFGDGYTKDELIAAARIDGNIVAALNEVEKARTWIEARI